MVAKKRQSKRQTTRKRVKIIHKVSEHHRKQRKEAKQKAKSTMTKKNDGNKKSKAAAKDPGMPGGMPASLKESFKTMMQVERDLEISQRKARQQHQKQTTMDIDSNSSNDPVGKQVFYRELRKVIDVSDVLLEVLDARDPEAFRSVDIEEDAMKAGKRIILVLNKADLVPAPVLQGWIRVLQRSFPCVTFSSFKANHHSHNYVGSEGRPVGGEGSATAVMQLLKNYCRNAGKLKTGIRVGLIGYPNVGKSSLINALKRSKACKTAATPGCTTVGQEVKLDSQITLIDCPGIISSSSAGGSVALKNCVRIEQVEDPCALIPELLAKCPFAVFQDLYTLPPTISSVESAEAFLDVLGKRLGKLKKGGVVDREATARVLLQDWNSGKIKYHTLPPAIVDTEASVVPEWAPAFQSASNDEIAVEQETEDNPEVKPKILAFTGKSEPKKYTSNDAGPRDQAVLNQFERSINPRLNQDKKQERKKAAKAARRAENKAAGSNINENQDRNDSGSDFDFGTDFRPLPLR